ncbi:MAG: hypothetical protein ACRDL5_14900 [Solirubrobacteraceae bacterium]
MAYALIYTDHGAVIEDFASRAAAYDALLTLVTEQPRGDQPCRPAAV